MNPNESAVNDLFDGKLPVFSAFRTFCNAVRRYWLLRKGYCTEATEYGTSGMYWKPSENGETMNESS